MPPCTALISIIFDVIAMKYVALAVSTLFIYDAQGEGSVRARREPSAEAALTLKGDIEEGGEAAWSYEQVWKS